MVETRFLPLSVERDAGNIKQLFELFEPIIRKNERGSEFSNDMEKNDDVMMI